MAENSKIEWTDHTANLWWGCTEVHAGCDNCYARKWSNRYNTGDKTLWGNGAPRQAKKGVWGDLLKWQAQAAANGVRQRVFVGSMMDIFEKPFLVVNGKHEPIEGSTDNLRQRFFLDFVPACPNLDFLLLTKRPSNIMKYIPWPWEQCPPPNVLFGTSPVDQKTYDTLVPQLLETPGRHFLSIEPQLAQINLNPDYAAKTHWIIQGGESGPGKRPFSLLWASSMRDQCKAQGIPYFFKQIDKVVPIPDRYLAREFYK